MTVALFLRADGLVGSKFTRSLPEKEPETFAVGRRVRHAIMGLGTVIDVDASKGAHLVRFDGFPTPRAISFRAKLEPVDEQACC